MAADQYFTLIVANRILDANGKPLSEGRAIFQPVDQAGAPASVKLGPAGVDGALIGSKAVVFPVSGGVLQPNDPAKAPQLADVFACEPSGFRYSLVIEDLSDNSIITGPGYASLQPTGASWSLGTYGPDMPAQAMVIAGAPGMPGPPGLPGSGANFVPHVAAVVGATTTIHNTGTNLYDYTQETANVILIVAPVTDSTGTYPVGALEPANNPPNTVGPWMITQGLATIYANIPVLGVGSPYNIGILHEDINGNVVGVDTNSYAEGAAIAVPAGTYKTRLGSGNNNTPSNQRMVSSSYALLASYVAYTNPIVVASPGTLTLDCAASNVQEIRLADGQFIAAGGISVINQFDGQEITIRLYFPSSGNAGITFPSNFANGKNSFAPGDGVVVGGLVASYKWQWIGDANSWIPVRDAGAAISSSSSSAAPVSARVVYASLLPGIVSNATIAIGSASPGTSQSSVLNAALAGGNVKLVVDGQYGLGAPLILHSNTEIELLPGCGFIMTAGSNCECFLNAHQNAPNVASGALLNGSPSGGMLVSNQVDHDITIRGGGLIHMNSSNGAVTGQQGGLSKTNPATGLWVNGMRLIGVAGLTLRDFEMYDSATYSINISNSNKVFCDRLYIHQPLPLVFGKNTDGLHFNGPVDDVTVTNCLFICGDDSIACNADDGQEVRFGDGNGPYVTYPGVVFGPITNFTADNNSFLRCATGFRFLSITELIDRVSVTNTRSLTVGAALAAARFYPSSTGPGNFGSISIDGFEADGFAVNGIGSQNSFFFLDGNMDNLTIANFRSNNPSVNWPIAWFLSGGILQQFALRDARIYNPTGTQAALLLRFDGSVQQPSISGLQWNRVSGSVLGGNVAPPKVTISNYDGPASSLLASGYTVPIHNGDAFTNS